ncbi:MAG: hypothetical protein KAR38_11995, partial [Calditrichia bacterium]|nr:hypothetical protein [Calditrichia bacterium]
YVCAICRGAREQKYKDKIRDLNKKYGPFTFYKQLDKMKKEYCDCCESCGEGYHISVVVKEFENIIDEN